MPVEVVLRQQEHAAAAVLELEPQERHLGKRGLQPLVAVADFDDQHPVRLQSALGAGEDAAHDVETVAPGPQGDVRLVPVLARAARPFRRR